MSNRLYGDQLQSSGRRFFSALDGAPGIITPDPAVLTLNGRQPIAVEPLTVFRTPATAVLTLSGLGFSAQSLLSPATAALSYGGLVPDEVRQLTISPALPAPLQSPPAQLIPTLITVWTTAPATAQLTLNVLEQNVTQGGNIGFVSPGVGLVSLSGLAHTILLGGIPDTGALSVQGLAPTLVGTTIVTPDVGLLSMQELSPALALPFVWIDDDPAPTRTWITDAAA